MQEDWALIKGAFCFTYHFDPDYVDTMDYKTFCELFASLSWQTTFVNVLNSRKETDRKKIKEFSASQYEDWLKWQKRKKIYDSYNEKINKINELQSNKAEKMAKAEALLREMQNKNN